LAAGNAGWASTCSVRRVWPVLARAFASLSAEVRLHERVGACLISLGSARLFGCVRYPPHPLHLSLRRAPCSCCPSLGAAVSSPRSAHTGASPQRKLLLDGCGSTHSRSWMPAALVLTSMPHLYAAGQRSPSRRPLTSCLSLSEPETGQVFTRIARSLFI
jgi:hypothetical protein